MMGESEGNSLTTAIPPVQSRKPLRPLSPTAIKSKKIRRKAAFSPRSDSDDDLTSPHGSIFEALYFSGGSGDDSCDGITLTNLPESGLSDEKRINDENVKFGGSNSPCKPAEATKFLYGNGTALDTITEQTSYDTIRSLARSRSVDEASKYSFLSHTDSLLMVKYPRRKQSFSLDDLALVKQSYHDACASIEGMNVATLAICEIYAEPKAPLHAPLQRPSTPPGMPSWTESQNAPRIRPLISSTPQRSRLSRFLGLPTSGTSVASRLYSSFDTNISPDTLIRSVSAPIRRAPRFRPPRSVYEPIHQHPFNSAPVAEVQSRPTAAVRSCLASGCMPKRQRRFGQRVRFTPSATARDSETNALRNAIESTSTFALHPLASIESLPYRPQMPAGITCPHRKGRQAALDCVDRAVGHQHTSAATNQDAPSSSPVYSTSSDVRDATSPPIGGESNLLFAETSAGAEFGLSTRSCNRPVSVSSTAQLLAESNSPSGTATHSPPSLSWAPLPKLPFRRLTGSKNDELQCWKCEFNKACEKLDKWWYNSVSFLCFVCCGIDIGDEKSVHCGPNSDRFREFDRASDPEMMGPRRVILNSTAGVGV